MRVIVDLKKNFNNVEAVSGVIFDVRREEIFGFLGSNSAGKTTTIDILCTMLKPSGGSATANEFDVTSSKDRVRRSIGIIFQENTLDEKLTACENLMLRCRSCGAEVEYGEKDLGSVCPYCSTENYRAQFA